VSFIALMACSILWVCFDDFIDSSFVNYLCSFWFTGANPNQEKTKQNTVICKHLTKLLLVSVLVSKYLAKLLINL
jgi:hypothetical protein